MKSVTFYCVDVVHIDTGEVIREHTGYNFVDAMKRLEQSKEYDLLLKSMGDTARWGHRFYEKTYIGRDNKELFSI